MAEYYKGTVTHVNQTFLFFELENKLRVYTALLYLNDINKNLPATNTIVEINKHLCSNDRYPKNCVDDVGDHKTIILSVTDQVDYDTVLPPLPNNKFAEILQSVPLCDAAAETLCAKDLIGIDKIFDDFEKYNLSISEQLVISTVEHIVTKIIGSTKNGFLHDFKLKFLNDYVDGRGPMFDRTNWTYLISHHHRPNEFMFGRFFIDAETGLPHFASGNEILPCTGFQEYTSRDIFHLIDKFILLKKYSLIREVYTYIVSNAPKNIHMKHLLFCIHDAVVLSMETPNQELLPIQTAFNGESFVMKFSCFIRQISMPILNDLGKLEVWLKVEDETNNRFMHLCIEEEFLKIFPALRFNCKYDVYAKRDLFKVYHRDVYKINSEIIRQGLPAGSIFVILFDLSEFAHFPNVDGAFQNLQNFPVDPKRMCTFRGKLTNKLLIQPAMRQTAARKPKFGIPGDYFLELQFESDSNKFSVFLVDWEDRPTPRCLIPNMILVVRDVIVRGTGRYYSTFFTTFEIVGYEPNLGSSSPDRYV